MPTPTKGPRLGGGPAHERLILANLATALFEHDRITTTEAKAKRLRPVAERLVMQTITGSTEDAIASKLHPAQLRNQVTSPGGTTAAALYEMEKGGLRTVVARAIGAAFERSQELGKK